MLIRWSALVAICVLACVQQPDAKAPQAGDIAPRPASRPDVSHAPLPTASVEKVPCTTPAGGLVISTERLGPFRASAPMAELLRECAGDTTDLYSISGIQGPSRVFRFVGAELQAVQFDCRSFDDVCPEQVPNYWVARGDSVRLPDGGTLPKTIGELRERYGKGFVTDDRGGDDSYGVEVHMCRLPHMIFDPFGDIHTTATVHPTPFAQAGVADSVRIWAVHLWIPLQEVAGFWEKTCQDTQDAPAT